MANINMLCSYIYVLTLSLPLRAHALAVVRVQGTYTRPTFPSAGLRSASNEVAPLCSDALREMGGAPRNPAPRNHFLAWNVKPSGCHCTNVCTDRRPLLGAPPLCSDARESPSSGVWIRPSMMSYIPWNPWLDELYSMESLA